ncbi:hypothetical protein B0H16DRAFT_1742537 [Mycena metata]|uniref:Secreted protein n=1 Tax=Mycena metata TaxID=1033252 RepID=A0AAD7H7X1_9AGAR|nr:hypothetical protein B0H16DRAFT_1742537 [Mycena metata]
MPTAYVMSFVAIVLSFVVHVHATVSATAPIPFPCAAYQPGTEHGVTHSHPRFMATRRERISGCEFIAHYIAHDLLPDRKIGESAPTI